MFSTLGPSRPSIGGRCSSIVKRLVRSTSVPIAVPLDILKLDRSFVEDIEHDPRGMELVRAIIQIAGALELDVVAEGIETSSQAAQLARAGCRCGQGFFYFGRPQAPEEAL